MKKLIAILPVCALLAVLMVGCGGGDDAGSGDDSESTSQNSANSSEITPAAFVGGECATCGLQAEEGCCDSGEDCGECSFKKDSALCCVEGLEPTEGVYCSCGNIQGSENCCDEEAETCECGLQAGSDLCCKVKTEASAN